VIGDFHDVAEHVIGLTRLALFAGDAAAQGVDGHARHRVAGALCQFAGEALGFRVFDADGHKATLKSGYIYTVYNTLFMYIRLPRIGMLDPWLLPRYLSAG
jgi:hypothetical protein